MSDEKSLEAADLQAECNGMAIMHNVSFNVHEDEILAILGSNGSGKTTILRAITGTIKPMSGIIRYKGEDITGMPPFKLVSGGVAMVPEGRMLFGGMTVGDNLLMDAYLSQDEKAIQERLELIYELFPRMEEKKKQIVSTLSEGEQQTVTIVRGFMPDPKLLILDGPSLGLVHRPAQEIFKFAKEIAAIGIMIIIMGQNAAGMSALCGYAFVIQNREFVIGGREEGLLSGEDVKRACLGE